MWLRTVKVPNKMAKPTYDPVAAHDPIGSWERTRL